MDKKCRVQERYTDISAKFLLGDLKTRENQRRIYEGVLLSP